MLRERIIADKAVYFYASRWNANMYAIKTVINFGN